MMSKRIMGLPLPVVLGVVAAGLLLGIYLRRKGSSSTDAGSATSYPLSLPDAGSSGSVDTGVAGGGLSPAYGAGIDPGTASDLLTGLGGLVGAVQENTAQQGSLVDSIGALVYSIPSSGGSGASAVGKKAANPIKSTATKKSPVKKAPGKKHPPTHPAQIHYQTLRKNVHLGAGQKLHFTRGKGYYAA